MLGPEDRRASSFCAYMYAFRKRYEDHIGMHLLHDQRMLAPYANGTPPEDLTLSRSWRAAPF